jgi:hypothetical protein
MPLAKSSGSPRPEQGIIWTTTPPSDFLMNGARNPETIDKINIEFLEIERRK